MNFNQLSSKIKEKLAQESLSPNSDYSPPLEPRNKRVFQAQHGYLETETKTYTYLEHPTPYRRLNSPNTASLYRMQGEEAPASPKSDFFSKHMNEQNTKNYGKKASQFLMNHMKRKF
ncbi:uncharacterized protein ASCRUDRAFT_70804 [Ascoidea rubescens DSM 1968]|uniref:Uncharacterized protein n=1 Tax=Ascoidea rubescens DSM 1968 TaxID=1344418 RepID=A0A1D2VFL6_9ASCO|nr:hypothetical protein ASCRUDRAFT_70804 [Ascoidea rubescens DSM 1968]ODV60267.1 hypothetical protein ASCRUDRAFT_70804 [Ascoidea rubescens DSM 1968]